MNHQRAVVLWNHRVALLFVVHLTGDAELHVQLVVRSARCGEGVGITYPSVCVPRCFPEARPFHEDGAITLHRASNSIPRSIDAPRPHKARTTSQTLLGVPG